MEFELLVSNYENRQYKPKCNGLESHFSVKTTNYPLEKQCIKLNAICF